MFNCAPVQTGRLVFFKVSMATSERIAFIDVTGACETKGKKELLENPIYIYVYKTRLNKKSGKNLL